MKKNKTLIGLLALGVLSTSAMAGCVINNPTTPTTETDDTPDQAAADAVIAKINALTNSSSESVVVEARNAYNALTAAQKNLVTNLNKLVAQETRINNAKRVQEVIDAIAALTDESTEEQVAAAFTKYNNLDDALKDDVTNFALLLAQKARIDAAVVVDPVIAAINALTDTSTKDQVKAAEAQYNALLDGEKDYVPADVVNKLNAQLERVLQEDISALGAFVNGVKIENLISDAAVIDVLQDMEALDLSNAVINGLTDTQKTKFELLKKTTDSYEYAGVNQAIEWFDNDKWSGIHKYGSVQFSEPQHDEDLNASVRSFEVTYYVEDETAHKEFGITLVGDDKLKDSAKEAVFYLYNPDIDTNMRIDFAKGSDETFCDGGTVTLKHGWNRLSVALNDVSDKHVINLMIGILNNEGGITETSGWKISSFVKYNENVVGAIRTEYYRISKLLKAYSDKQEATERNEYRTICEEYAKLTADEKAKLPEGVATKIAADETTFKVADANALNDLLGNIPAITSETDLIDYAGNYLDKLVEYKAQYDTFDASQKVLVTNAAKLDGLDALSSYKVLTDGSEQFVGWTDYPDSQGPDSVSDTDPTYGNVQKVTTTTAENQIILFPSVTGYEEYDVVYFNVYCPEGSMLVVSGPYWPYNIGTLQVGWNKVCVPVELFVDTYPANSIGIFLNGVGEWKFTKAVAFVNTKGAEELVNQIDELTYTAQAGEEEAIIAAREAFNALGFKSKTLVTNLSVLETFEGQVDAHYADTVMKAINALTFTHTDESTAETEKAAIEAARASYDALNDTRKALVTNLNKLTELESDVANYYKDQLVAALKAQISDLTVINSSTTFDVALASYVEAGKIKDNLYYAGETEQSEKDKVEGVVTFFESTYTKISDTINGAAGDPTVNKVTDNVYGEVTSITGTTNGVQATFAPSDSDTVANYDFIYVLMKTEVDGTFNLWGATWGMDDVQTFGGLSGGTWNILKINTSSFNTGSGASEKLFNLDFVLGELTNNHGVLMTAAYGFVDTAAANSVKEQIGALTYTEHSGAEESAIASARSAYDALGKASKTLVTNYETLTSMESSVDSHYVSAVVDAINALEFDDQGSTQEAQKTAIEAARAAYNALSDARKAMVTNLSKLVEMEAAVAAYYKAERLSALVSDITALPEEITTSTSVEDAMKIKVVLAKCEAHDLYGELEQSYKDKITALKEDIAGIYTTLLDGTSALNGWDYGPVGDTTSAIDDEFGNVQKITFENDAQHSLRLPISEEYEKYDEVYISVYCPSGSLTLVNGAFWPYAYGSVSEGWNVIKVPGNVFADNYPTHSLGFLFNGTGEWKFGMVLGCSSQQPETPARTITFGEGGITLQSENKASTAWPSCTKTEISDQDVGVAYQYNASEFAGDVKGNQLYWVMNEQQVANVVAGFGSEMDIYVPDDGNTYQFAFQCGDTSTAWRETTRIQLVGGQWNHITIDQAWLAGLDFTGAGNVAFVRLYGGDFQTDDIKLTPIYKREGVKTSLSLGTLTDTGTDHELLGNIYDYARKVDFKDSTDDLNTISYFDPTDFVNALGEDKEELVFEIYNPTDSDYSIHFAGGAGWTDGSFTTLKAKEWTRVKITKDDIAIGKTGRLYVYVNGMGDQTGWQVTDIFAI